MISFLYQAVVYLTAAVIAVPIASRLGMGSVLGYLAAGIIVGPVLHLVGSETQDLQHFAEFGVVMMLFLIGLELEPRALWDMRHRLIGLGGLQVGITMLTIGAAAVVLGQPWTVGLAIGMVFALSSTAIVLQTLNEKDLMSSPGGRSSFSVLLTQDIAVIPMLAFLPLLAISAFSSPAADDGHGTDAHASAGHGDGGHGDAAHGAGMSLVEGLPGWGATLVTLGAVALVILVGIYLTRPAFRFIGWANLREMYTALALAIVVGIAFLMNLVGLSPALGTFLAGVVLANSEFRHELESDLDPFRGLLLGLFFITVGAGINFDLLFGNFGTILGLTLGLVVTKGLILFGLTLIFKLRGRDQWLFTLGLAQAGEFGFVLVSFSVQQSVIPGGLSEVLLLVIALSMLLTPLLFIVYEALAKRLADSEDSHETDEIDDQGTVIIAGIGRFGQIVNRLVRNSGIKTVVLDHNMETIQVMRRFGFPGFFGDPTRPDLLHAAGLMDARVLVVCVDEPEAAVKLVTHARRERPDLHIIARARDRREVYRLYQAGADDIVREMFDSSLRAGRYVLENAGLSEFEAAQAEEIFFKHDRFAIKELAPLWDVNLKPSENQAYIDRARELEHDLEMQLMGQIEARDAAEKDQEAS